MANKLIKITEKEKKSPAYRKKIEQENDILKKTLKTTQDQASTLQQKNLDLEKLNVVSQEKLKNQGFKTVAKDACLLLVGAAISYLVEVKYPTAAFLFVLAFILVFIVWIIDAFNNKTS